MVTPSFPKHLFLLDLLVLCIAGFRLQDVTSAKLAQRRKNKNVSNDNSRSFSSTSSSLSSSSSGTSSLKTPCSSTQPSVPSKPVKRINKDASSGTVFDFAEARVQEYLSSLSSSSSSEHGTSPPSSSTIQLQLSPVRKKKKPDLTLTLPASNKPESEQLHLAEPSTLAGTKRKHKPDTSSQCSKSLPATHTTPARKKKKADRQPAKQEEKQPVPQTTPPTDLVTLFEEQLLGPITRARRRKLNTDITLVENASTLPVETVPRQRMSKKPQSSPSDSHSKKSKRQKQQWH